MDGCTQDLSLRACTMEGFNVRLQRKDGQEENADRQSNMEVRRASSMHITNTPIHVRITPMLARLIPRLPCNLGLSLTRLEQEEAGFKADSERGRPYEATPRSSRCLFCASVLGRGCRKMLQWMLQAESTNGGGAAFSDGLERLDSFTPQTPLEFPPKQASAFLPMGRGNGEMGEENSLACRSTFLCHILQPFSCSRP